MNDVFLLLQQSPVTTAVFACLTGLLLGSFLNVVIHRLPLMMKRDWRSECEQMLEDEPGPEAAIGNNYNLVVPRSACPHCGHAISAMENIPVLSYLVLRGQCSNCGAKISPRYPAVEFLTGIASLLVALRFGFGVELLAALLMTWMLVAMSGIDIDTFLLPDSLTLPLLWTGLVMSLFHGKVEASVLFVDPQTAIIGAAAGYLTLWSVFWVFKLATGKEGMGYGDFKLLAALGAWLGWQKLPLIILLSALVGAVIGIAMIVLQQRGRQTPIPFGPYLAMAGWVAMLWGDAIIDGYLGYVG